jgi:peroxiredoxin
LDDNLMEKQTPDTLKNVPVGKHKVSVSKEGYNSTPEFDTVEVVENFLIKVEFILVEKVGAIFVNSDTSGAQIILDHIPIEKVTPDTIFDVTVGDHIVSVTKSGYSVFPESAMVEVIEDSLTTVNFVLTQDIGGLIVNSTPQGAEIYLNRENSGELTPHLFDLPEGSYIVSVEKPGYLPSPESLIVSVFEDQTTSAEFILLDTLFGSLSVLSNPGGATIVIDNQITGSTTPHTFFNNVPRGMHIVSVVKEGYSNDPPAKEIVNVVTGDAMEVNFNLSPASVDPDSEGYLAPDFELLDDYGELIRLYNYRGSVVIVMFWAESCFFCKMELDFLQEQYEKYSGDSLMIFAVNYWDDVTLIQKMRREKSLTYHLLVGKDSQMLEDYHMFPGITAVPITIIIDRSGLIYRWVQGFDSSAKTQMREALYDLFGHD